ncbi:uncharacterized protein LOC115890569 [Sitophilus oryzae]|uniref:Uncharacterized protein LOC115890569 n=1 Tax=Sitophilus oryzae TaxID=7048 RepID=A0A6J2YTQ4_SITOR|nr:uncharacterized protein LOC115890569 [Sitophilus oryzae]
MAYRLVISLIWFGGLCLSARVKKFPTYVDKCHQDDTDFTKCMLKAIQNVKPHLKSGIPEFRLPKMDPLILPEVGLDAGAGFIAKFENVEIYDADKFTIRKFDIDLDEDKIKFDMSFPHIRIKAHYSIFGKVLFFNLDGSGPADGNITNCRVMATVNGERYVNQDKQYLKLTDIAIEGMDFGKPNFQFYNLFKNNPELTEQTNRILNDNMEELLNDLRPNVEQTIGKTVLEFIGRVFTRFSIEELFPK